MAGMKLKNGADLCGFELRRFTIQNDSSDPTDLKVGRKYFNNGGGTAHLRERIYVGDKTITTDGWRDAAYMDDIKRLEGIIGSLDGNVGDNLLGLAEQLNAVQAKVDAFLEGDVDADAVLENLNELKQFLDTYSGDVTLSQVLNDINEEVAKKADKATTLDGYGITDAVLKQDYINLNDLATTHAQVMGYGNPDGGWKAYSSGILSKVHDVGFALQGLTNTLFFRGISGSVWDDKWHAILHEDNYSNFLDSVYLKQSGGTITGGVGALEVKRNFTDGGSYILFSNTARTLGYIGVNSSMMPAFTQDGSVYYALLHEGNYESIVGDKFLKRTGGTISSVAFDPLIIHNPNTGSGTYMAFKSGDIKKAYFGYSSGDFAFIQYGDSSVLGVKSDGAYYNNHTILHAGNYSNYALPLTGGTLSGTLDMTRESGTKSHKIKFDDWYWAGFLYQEAGELRWGHYVDDTTKNHIILHTGNFNSYAPKLDGTGASGTWGIDISGNAASATKLQTARTIWGNSFDGTADINGDIHLAADKGIVASNGYAVLIAPSYLLLGYAQSELGQTTYLDGNDIYLRYGKNHVPAMYINSSGNVTIGNSDWAGENCKLFVDGIINIGSYGSLHRDVNSHMWVNYGGSVAEKNLIICGYNTSFYYGKGSDYQSAMFINSSGNVGIGTSAPAYKLDVNGTLGVSSRLLVGGATDDRWISLQVKGATDIDGVLYINAHSKEGIYFTENGVHWHNTAAGWVSSLFEFNSNNIFARKLFKAQSGIEIPTEQTLKIGDATLSWDATNNALKVDKNFYSTEEVSAGGVGSGTTSGGGGGTNNTKAFDIPIGTESMTFAHNLGTKDVIVAIYEISDSYQQILADVIINNISEVTIMFGEATEVAHRVVIMG